MSEVLNVVVDECQRSMPGIVDCNQHVMRSSIGSNARTEHLSNSLAFVFQELAGNSAACTPGGDSMLLLESLGM